jgi:CHAT domain-containing protein
MYLTEEVKAMKLQTIGSTVLFSLLAALSGGEFLFIPSAQAKIPPPQVLAQHPAGPKAEADRLLKQGIEQFQTSQLQAALQSWQQALIVYREIKDRQGEGWALGNLGVAYRSLGDYSKAIEYAQQQLAIAREIKDRQSEGKALGNLGVAYLSLGDYTKAIEYQQQWLALARSIKDRQSEGKALGNLGGAYLSLGDYAKAIEYAQQLLAIARSIKDRQSEGAALGNLGLAYLNLGDYPKAIEYQQQSLAIARSIKDRQSEGQALGTLGGAYLSLGDYAKAIEYAQQSLAIARSIKDRPSEGTALGILGIAYMNLGDNTKAIEYQQQSLAIARSIKDRQSEGTALGILGIAYMNLGDNTKAIEYQQQSLAIARSIKDRQSEGQALGTLGDAYMNLGDYTKAIEYAQQSLAIARSIKDRQSEGTALGSLGQAYLYLGDYTKAIEYAQQWLAIARSIKDRQSEGTALGSLGGAYLQLGDYTKAIEYQQQWLAIARSIKGRQSEGRALGGLGLAYLYLGDYTKAIEYIQQDLAIAREIKDRQSEGWDLGSLGEVYLYLGDYPKALEYIQQHLAIARSIKDRQNEGKALGILGLAYLQLGDYAKGREYAQQWLAIAREIKDRQNEGKALGNLGGAYLQLGDYTKAIEYQQQWLAIARSIKDRPSEGIALSNLGLALYRQGNLSAAEKTLLDSIKVSESLRAGLDDAKKVSIFDTHTQPYLHLQKVLIAQKKTNEALEIAERGRARAFVELLAARLAPSASAQLTINPPNIQQIQQIAKEQNATLVEYSTIGNEALYIWVIKPTGEITFRSVDLASLNIDLGKATEDTRVFAATRRGLNEQDTAFAEMIRGTRDSLGISENNLSNQQATNRPHSTPANSQTANPKLQQLYQLLIEPIADLLPTDPNAHVIFIPHQSLFLAPFATLQNAQGQYLIEKHTIIIAPAIQILQLTRQARQKVRQVSPQNILVVGNPTMPKIGNPPRQLPSLPGSEQEAQIIAKLLNTQAIIGSQATKVSIVKQMSNARIIHLATHGFFKEVKSRDLPGAIALAPSGNDDGFLTSSEILDLKLNAELVVLSACNTGRGRLTGDGVIGLSRALITAGVPTILTSLWPVLDGSTAELMPEFYRQLQQNPNKAQALRQAMLIMMKKHPNPRDWGAFTLIGEAE